MSTSLSYAPPGPTIRPWPMAAGAALVAVVAAIFPILDALRPRLGFSLREQFLCGAGMDVVFPGAIVAAIVLLARGLPPRTDGKIRWTVLVCLLLAGVHFLVCATSGIHLLILADTTGGHSAFGRFFRMVGGLQTALQAVLLVFAAMFFVVAASRARHAALGIIAACGLIPDTLFLIVDSAQMFTDFLDALPAIVLRVYLAVRDVHFYGVVLVWISVALFAGIFALTTRHRWRTDHPRGTSQLNT